MTTIADFKKLFKGLPDDTPILVYNSELVIADCSPTVEATAIAADESYFWRDNPEDEELEEEGYDPKTVTTRKCIWINGDEP